MWNWHGFKRKLGARLKLKPAEPTGPGSQYSYLRATRNKDRCGHHPHCTTRLTSMSFWTSWVSATSANQCRPRLSKRARRAMTSQDWVEGDRRYHRCVGILRLLKYRPNIASAVHDASKKLASPGAADLRRLRRLCRYLLERQKLRIMV